ncbi:coiled-coil domain-containing protein 174 [Musca domestica]|uniref:Coiled-coil domain-containing protein 174 n=1 Tax=Musca domestica TaxID=7370 RepID=A0A1I8MS63_MUSDO|nr:coiled-coil domain-containing protein 174 [Musca domestica]
MNDPNKVINVNLSSLLSLKAELLRKQAEVTKAKNQTATTTTTSSPAASGQEYVSIKSQRPLPDNLDGDITTSHKRKDKKKRAKELEKSEEKAVYEHEDSLLLEKSQKILEAKAKFYERMTKSGGKLNSDDNCLVMFNKKKQEEDVSGEGGNNSKTYSSDESDDSSVDDDYSDHNDDPEDDWVEYTDCLGRTRKCLKRDLEDAKRRDKELAASMPERLDQTKANWLIDTLGSKKSTSLNGDKAEDDDEIIGPLPPASVFGDGLSMMSKHEEQKANWERKEQENLEKTDVHYQDVFFDEARQHGVGYYAFSTDEEERKKQQKELLKAREKTLQEQERREQLRAQREKIIAERVLAAKNRQRARLGLPPLEKEEVEEKSPEEEKVEETKEERKARKKAEKLERKRQREEEEREKERQQHIRPWDEEKDGVKTHRVQAGKNGDDDEDGEWQYKPEREPMTQEQWNEYKRKERPAEFAPPTERPMKRTNFRSNTTQANYTNVPPPAMETFDEPPQPSRFNTFQSSKRKEKVFKRRNYDEQQQHQQQNDDYDDSNARQNGVCIPPPSNLEDFFLPSHAKKPKTAKEVEKSIEAGLRFIRESCDKQMPATKSSWTAKADY